MITQSTKIELEKDSDAVALDAQSLTYFFRESPVFKRLREDAIESGFSFETPDGWDEEEHSPTDYTASVVERCHALGIKLIADLKKTLDYEPKPFLKKAREGNWYVTDPFLAFLLLVKAKVDAFSVPMLRSEGFAKETAERLLAAANSTK